jgi:hypothetical protein
VSALTLARTLILTLILQPAPCQIDLLDDCIVVAGSNSSAAVCPTPSGWSTCAPAGSERQQ